MGTEDDEREDSLAPVSVNRLSVEEEVALMDRGKGGRALLVVGLIACLAAVSLVWLRGMDASKVYADLGSATSQLQEQQVDGFVHCALAGTHASQMREGGKLATAIEQSAARMPARYATTLKRCGKKLAALHEELLSLEAPADMEREVQALRGAAAQLEAAVLGYADALWNTDVRQDALPSAHGIGEAWNAYADQADTLHIQLLERR